MQGQQATRRLENKIHDIKSTINFMKKDINSIQNSVIFIFFFIIFIIDIKSNNSYNKKYF